MERTSGGRAEKDVISRNNLFTFFQPHDFDLGVVVCVARKVYQAVIE